MRQTGNRILSLVIAAGLGAGMLAPELRAGESASASHRTELQRPYVPMVRMHVDRRVSPREFARRSGTGDKGLRALHGATGLVRCGNATGTAQLTLRNDVITTAAHVLFDKNGRQRSGCVFQPMAGPRKEPVAIDMASLRSGSRRPFSEPATRDWAVARLVKAVPGVRPYGIAGASVNGAPVVMCAGGNGTHGSMGTERCSTRGTMGSAKNGIREIAIDCNAGPGSSGAALLSGNRIVGIYVGYRSTDPARPRAFSKTHYNFAITVEGPFRQALLAAAGR